MYLFDTNILSEVVKKKPSSMLMQRLAGVSGVSQFTSCICVMELRYGSRRRPDHEIFWKRLNDEVLSLVEILEITAHTAILAGDLAAELSRQGLGISAEDLLIAASAMASGMTLVTANLKHFEVIPGLKVENWIR